MSLTGTLARMVIGGLVAKGVRNMTRGGSNRSSSGGGLGGLLGSVLGGGRSNNSGGGLGEILGGARRGGGLGDILSGGGGNTGGGGLGGLLGGNKQSGSQLDDILADDNQTQSRGGGLGSILEGLGGAKSSGSGSLGGVLDSVFRGDTDPRQINTSQEQEQQAEILLRAMLNAAKSDGSFDDAEQEGVLKQLGDVDEDEARFIKNEMRQPLDIQGFIQSVPQGMEQQVYMMSLLAIDLDSKAEAQYLDQLRRGLDITEQVSNQIHEQVGAPVLYS